MINTAWQIFGAKIFRLTALARDDAFLGGFCKNEQLGKMKNVFYKYFIKNPHNTLDFSKPIHYNAVSTQEERVLTDIVDKGRHGSCYLK